MGFHDSLVPLAQGEQVKCRPKKRVIIKVSHSAVAGRRDSCVCVWGGGGGGGGGEGVQRPSGMTGISAILFNLNNFTVSHKA